MSRFEMYLFYGKINRGPVICPLSGGSFIRGFTVFISFLKSCESR